MQVTAVKRNACGQGFDCRTGLSEKQYQDNFDLIIYAPLCIKLTKSLLPLKLSCLGIQVCQIETALK